MANARNLTTLAVKLGMRYYEEQNLVFGKLAGYECAVREQPDKKMMMVHMVAKPDKSEDASMERLLGQLQQENPAVTAAVYENFTASLRLNTVKEEEPLQQAENLLKYSGYQINEIANYLSFSSQSHFAECFKKATGAPAPESFSSPQARRYAARPRLQTVKRGRKRRRKSACGNVQ